MTKTHAPRPLEVLLRTFDDQPAHLLSKIGLLYVVLLAGNLAAWLLAFASFRHYPVLLGTSLLAFGFGLRHAVDADHIAAIDNVTRKLMQDGSRPIGVGLFFSLGHSSVVVLACVGVAATAMTFKDRIESLHAIGGLIGTSISAIFLLVLAVLNLFILAHVVRAFLRAKASREYVEEDLNILLAKGGLLSRLLRPLFGMITRSWHMYPLGVLFGLGFDTATEIGLLGISAAEASKGLPLWSILIFPALFTAGMTLIDTTDSILMLGAYGWAFVKPLRKLYYNVTITFVSVVVALVVGGVEAMGLLREQLSLSGAFWDGVGQLNDHFGALGYLIIAIFALSWVCSMMIYRLYDYDSIELELGDGKISKPVKR
jgi:high-affinity nickel-transport protein